MKKLIAVTALAVVAATGVSANGKGPSGIFSSEGFGFNRDNGSFAGCQSSGQGLNGNTGCQSNANSSFETVTGARGVGDLNAGNFNQRERQGSYQRGSFGFWDHSRGGNTDFLAIGNGSRGVQQTNSFQGYQFSGQGEYQSQTRSTGSNGVNTFSNFGY